RLSPVKDTRAGPRGPGRPTPRSLVDATSQIRTVPAPSAAAMREPSGVASIERAFVVKPTRRPVSSLDRLKPSGKATAVRSQSVIDPSAAPDASLHPSPRKRTANPPASKDDLTLFSGST